jgi:hypothetical protein
MTAAIAMTTIPSTIPIVHPEPAASVSKGHLADVIPWAEPFCAFVLLRRIPAYATDHRRIGESFSMREEN